MTSSEIHLNTVYSLKHVNNREKMMVHQLPIRFALGLKGAAV